MSDISSRLSAALADRYTLERELGTGGMATVYLAYDLKHDRKVAIKVLRPELAAVLGAERFVQEIKTTANLQHPNILPLFDSGEADGFLYYVMPYVEGESLRDTLNREKQLSVEDTVSIAMSVAAALEYAHEHGVVHRDIKPENILIQSGQALVADFGIALAISQAGGHRLTQTGLTVGTPAYMSPEQATGGRHIDARSDVYSVGCVLYEMLAGEPPHTGPTAHAVIAGIIAEEPTPISERRKSLPPHVEYAVHRALQKLPADRFRSAKALAEALSGSRSTPLPARTFLRRSRRPERAWMAATAGLAVVSVVLGVVALRGSHSRGSGPELKVQLSWPQDQAPDTTTGFALSPDGTALVFRGHDQRLWLRKLNELESHPLPGTENGENPFFSPDGRSVAFFTAHVVKVAPVDGGPVRTLVEDSADAQGGDWARDGMVYYSSLAGAVWRVLAAGGRAERVSGPDSAGPPVVTRWVDVLPNGKAALLSIWHGSTSSMEVGVLNLTTGRIVSLFRGTYARYAVPGYVVYRTPQGELAAVPFDLERLAVTGAARPVAEHVACDVYSGRAQFALSETATLLYNPVTAEPRGDLVWVTSDGSVTSVDTTWRANFYSLALSPDGQRVGVTITSGGREDIWVKNLRLGSLTRLTLDGQGSVNYRAQWTVDGRSLTFVSDRAGPTSLWVEPVDGSAPARMLVSDPRAIDEGFLSPDGDWIVYRTFGGGANTRDIYAVRAHGAETARHALAATTADEYSPALSPDGRWLTYVSEESGRPEVYVRPFPSASTARWQVSVDGGSGPVWARSGRRLYYNDARLALMEVDVGNGADFTWSAPRRLFDATPFEQDPHHPRYALTPDDRRFLMVRSVTEGVDPFVLVLNWLEELK